MLYLHSHFDSASSKVPLEIPWTVNNYGFEKVLAEKGNLPPDGRTEEPFKVLFTYLTQSDSQISSRFHNGVNLFTADDWVLL